jgi:hypothetical protein
MTMDIKNKKRQYINSSMPRKQKKTHTKQRNEEPKTQKKREQKTKEKTTPRERGQYKAPSQGKKCNSYI